MEEEVDFNLIINRVSVRTLVATVGDAPQNLSTYTVKMVVYKTVPVELNAAIGGTSFNELTFTFDNTINTEEGLFEYEVIATPIAPGDPLFLGRGNIYFTTNLGFTTQIPTLVQKEALGLTINEDFQTQTILYWKLFLQETYKIADEDLHDDASWPILVRFLIAKLVVHDYMTQLMKSSLAASFGSTDEGIIVAGSGDLKKIQTGPSTAEWYDSADKVTKLSASSAGGLSAFDQLSLSICTLTLRLGLWFPMCGDAPMVAVLPVVGRVYKCRYWNNYVTCQTCLHLDYGPDRG